MDVSKQSEGRSAPNSSCSNRANPRTSRAADDRMNLIPEQPWRAAIARRRRQPPRASARPSSSRDPLPEDQPDHDASRSLVVDLPQVGEGSRDRPVRHR